MGPWAEQRPGRRPLHRPPLSLLCLSICTQHPGRPPGPLRLFTKMVLEKAAERVNPVTGVTGPEWPWEPPPSVCPQAMGQCDRREASRALSSGVASYTPRSPRRPGPSSHCGLPVPQLWHLRDGSLGCHTVSHRTRDGRGGWLHASPWLVAPVGKPRPEQHGGTQGRCRPGQVLRPSLFSEALDTSSCSLPGLNLLCLHLAVWKWDRQQPP